MKVVGLKFLVICCIHLNVCTLIKSFPNEGTIIINLKLHVISCVRLNFSLVLLTSYCFILFCCIESNGSFSVLKTHIHVTRVLKTHGMTKSFSHNHQSEVHSHAMLGSMAFFFYQQFSISF